jgi:hypothetical protein
MDGGSLSPPGSGSMAGVNGLANWLTRPSEGWHWSVDAFPPVWFCVRSLVLDGLAVPPFDRHTGGDGSLRRLGLGAETWRAWLGAVLRQHMTMSELAGASAIAAAPGPLPERALGAIDVLREPGSFCPGGEALRARLNERFADDAPAGEAWKWRMSDVPAVHGSARQQRALWKALTPFHGRLETLSVLLVDYAEPVMMPVPPTSCLIAPDMDPAAFARQVVAAANALVTHASG